MTAGLPFAVLLFLPGVLPKYRSLEDRGLLFSATPPPAASSAALIRSGSFLGGLMSLGGPVLPPPEPVVFVLVSGGGSRRGLSAGGVARGIAVMTLGSPASGTRERAAATLSRGRPSGSRFRASRQQVQSQPKALSYQPCPRACSAHSQQCFRRQQRDADGRGHQGNPGNHDRAAVKAESIEKVFVGVVAIACRAERRPADQDADAALADSK